MLDFANGLPRWIRNFSGSLKNSDYYNITIESARKGTPDEDSSGPLKATKKTSRMGTIHLEKRCAAATALCTKNASNRARNRYNMFTGMTAPLEVLRIFVNKSQTPIILSPNEAVASSSSNISTDCASFDDQLLALMPSKKPSSDVVRSTRSRGRPHTVAFLQPSTNEKRRKALVFRRPK